MEIGKKLENLEKLESSLSKKSGKLNFEPENPEEIQNTITDVMESILQRVDLQSEKNLSDFGKNDLSETENDDSSIEESSVDDSFRQLFPGQEKKKSISENDMSNVSIHSQKSIDSNGKTLDNSNTSFDLLNVSINFPKILLFNQK